MHVNRFAVEYLNWKHWGNGCAAVLILLFIAMGAQAQDIYGAWLISIQVTGGPQVPAGVNLQVAITGILSLQPGSSIQEQTSGDLLPGVLNSAGFGAWTYGYSSNSVYAQGSVKFVSLATSKDGFPLGTRSTVLQLTALPDGSMTGTYQATLVDPSGNVVYQVAGTLTATSLKIDRASLFNSKGVKQTQR